MGVEPLKEVKDQVKDKISLLNTLIGNKKYAAADHLTIADLSLYSMMGQVYGIAEEEKWNLNQFPNLNKWNERVQAEHSHLVEIASKTDFGFVKELYLIKKK